MAVVSFFGGSDPFDSMLSYRTTPFISDIGTASKVTLRSASDSTTFGVFEGNFKYTSQGAVSGEVTRISNAYNGLPVSGYSTTIPVDLDMVLSFITNKNSIGLAKYLLSGNDLIGGLQLDDKLYGYSGNDTIYGYSGNDYIYGGDGDDLLYGGMAMTMLMRGGGKTQ